MSNIEQVEFIEKETTASNHLLLLAIFLFAVLTLKYPHTTREQSAQLANIAPQVLPKREFNTPNLKAQAAYVLDPKENLVIFGKNSKNVRPLASLTKIMTAIVALEHAPRTLPVMNSISDREMLTRESTLERMLIASSNSAALSIAALPITFDGDSQDSTRSFIALMNKKSEDLGLFSTRFRNPTGLDLSETISGADGSAEEVAQLIWYGVSNYPELFAKTGQSILIQQTPSGAPQRIENTNEVVQNLPPVLASKTGLTDLAGGNLALVFDVGINHPIVAVVLGSTEKERFEDMQKLVRETLNYFASDMR